RPLSPEVCHCNRRRWRSRSGRAAGDLSSLLCGAERGQTDRKSKGMAVSCSAQLYIGHAQGAAPPKRSSHRACQKLTRIRADPERQYHHAEMALQASKLLAPRELDCVRLRVE